MESSGKNPAVGNNIHLMNYIRAQLIILHEVRNHSMLPPVLVFQTTIMYTSFYMHTKCIVIKQVNMKANPLHMVILKQHVETLLPYEFLEMSYIFSSNSLDQHVPFFLQMFLLQ